MVSDMGRLVGAISIDDLVLVAQNVRAGADAASVVGFHAVGRVEQRERGLGSLSGFPDGVDHLFVTALVASGVRRAGIYPAPPHGLPARLWPAAVPFVQPFEHLRQNPPDRAYADADGPRETLRRHVHVDRRAADARHFLDLPDVDQLPVGR